MRSYVKDLWMWLLLLLVTVGHLLGTLAAGVTPGIALVIIDVQNCFVKGGTLEVSEGNEVIPQINMIRRDYKEHFDLVVLSQDWHCPNHVSFWTQHNGRQQYDIITLYYTENGDLCRQEGLTSQYAVDCQGQTSALQQTLWPPHCIINSTDADIHNSLYTEDDDVIVRKGYHCQLDSYSVFYDNGGFGQTELKTILQEHDISTLFITGLARDYCVYFTAKDSQSMGYTTYVIEDATRAVAEDTGIAAINDMKARGIHVIQSADLESTLVLSGTDTLFTNSVVWGGWAVVICSVQLLK